MLKLIIADDELNIVELIRRMIDPQIAEVLGVASNGIEAYELICKTHADILITDICMPGYSGLELIEKVKNAHPDTDFIVISGYREFDYLQSILKYGVQEFLLKPVDNEELNSAIRRIGRKRGQADGRAKYVADIEVNLMQSYKKLREEYTLKMLYEGGKCLREKNLPDNLFHFQDGKFCAAILKADCMMDDEDSALDNLPYLDTLLERYRDMIINAFRNGCFDIAHALRNNKMYFVFNYASDLPDDVFWNQLDFNRNSISDMLLIENYKYGFLHFTFGIGVSANSLEELNKSFSSAIRAIGNRLNPCDGGVILNKQENYDGPFLLEAGVREQLAAAIVSLDSAKVLNILKEQGDVFVQREEYYRLYDLAAEAASFSKNYVIMQNLMEETDYEQLSNIIELIDNCYTEDMLYNCMGRYFNGLIERIRTIGNNRASKPIRLAMEYMKQNYTQQITLQSVAETVFYSPNYFSNAFKKETGKTFLEYLTDLRMEAAQGMLKNTVKSIGEIARLVGYSDEKYFSKLFTKVVGIKPNEYRKFYA